MCIVGVMDGDALQGKASCYLSQCTLRNPLRVLFTLARSKSMASSSVHEPANGPQACALIRTPALL
jgi:hypothetical protein